MDLRGIMWYVVPDLLNAAYCAIICLCCVWCLKTRGARPWPWLSIVLVVAGIPLTLWAQFHNYITGVYNLSPFPFGLLGVRFRVRNISLPEFLARAADLSRRPGMGFLLVHELVKLGCVAMSVLGPGIILLYQLRQRKRPK